MQLAIASVETTAAPEIGETVIVSCEGMVESMTLSAELWLVVPDALWMRHRVRDEEFWETSSL